MIDNVEPDHIEPKSFVSEEVAQMFAFLQMIDDFNDAFLTVDWDQVRSRDDVRKVVMEIVMPHFHKEDFRSFLSDLSWKADLEGSAR